MFSNGPSEGADKAGRFAIKGAGLADCEQYLKARDGRTPDFPVYAGWIDGYVTALNRFQGETYDLAPWQVSEILAGMVAGYCKQHGKTNFAEVVDRLAVNLAADRLVERSELVRVVYKEQEVLIYQEVLRKAKRTLKRKGLFAGDDADGSFDESLAKALVSFQKEKKLDATGLPNYLTLYHLFRES